MRAGRSAAFTSIPPRWGNAFGSIAIDLRLGMLSRLELTLSAGYAAAFESAKPNRHEGMLSLKILR